MPILQYQVHHRQIWIQARKAQRFPIHQLKQNKKYFSVTGLPVGKLDVLNLICKQGLFTEKVSDGHGFSIQSERAGTEGDGACNDNNDDQENKKGRDYNCC